MCGKMPGGGKEKQRTDRVWAGSGIRIESEPLHKQQMECEQ